MWSRPERESIKWALDGARENAASAMDGDSEGADLVLRDERSGWIWSVPSLEAAEMRWWLASDERETMAGMCAVRVVYGALWQLGTERGVACDCDESMTSARARAGRPDGSAGAVGQSARAQPSA